MNELSAQSTNDLMFNNINDNSNGFETQNHNKRPLNRSDYFERKRFCHNEHSFGSLFGHNMNAFNDNTSDDNTSDDYEDEEMTQFDHLLLNISNRLINFSINFVDIPEWPVFVDNSIDVHNKKSITTEESSVTTTQANGPQFPPKLGQIMYGFCLDSLVKTDKRYAVFVGHKGDKTDEHFIIKVGIESGVRLLEIESNNYKTLKGGEAVPKLIDFVRWKQYSDNYRVHNWAIVVTQKLDLNLVQLMTSLVSLPIEMVFDFAVQMIDRIEYIHDKGLIHCALKPENFVIESELSLKLFIIGLSSSKPYLIKKSDGTLEHIEYQKDQKLPKGDPHFHSIGYHNGIRRSRRDDMESIGYCIVYLTKGSLPWIGGQHKDLSSAQKIRLIGNRMQETTIEELCHGLSTPFSKYFEIISHLSFKERPNYEALRQCFSFNNL